MTTWPAAGEPGPPGAGTAPLGPRQRIVLAAAHLISTQGVSGTGMREIVAAAGAPRGSLQHYFPGGKDQLVTEAIMAAGEVAAWRVRRFAARVPRPTPGDLFMAMAARWRDIYLDRGFADGCPLAAGAADSAATSPVLRDAVGRALGTWRDSLAETLAVLGVPTERTRPLACLMISAVEGALIMARSQEDTEALDAVAAELRPLLDQAARAAPEAPGTSVPG